MSTARVMIFKRFELFWHWLQAIMIIGMIINDSGVVVPALGYAVASPLWLIMIVREARCSSVE